MKATYFAVALAILSAYPVFGQRACGGAERWSVKTLADTEASSIDKRPVEKTVAQMVALQTRPSKVDGALPRQPGTETTIYTIKALLTLYKEEADRDYHLVLEEPNDSDTTMIAEIPDPECAPNSSVLDQIRQARETLSRRFPNVGADKHATKIPVTITGVGFFDIEHGGAGQLGHAPNNIELHPVLNIEFTGPVPPDFETPTVTSTGAAASVVTTAAYQPSLGLMWWVIALAMTIFYIVAIYQTVGTLRRSQTWSLSEALKDVDEKPSSSRLIAFLGLLILMVLFIGIGYVAIWRLLNNEKLPDVSSFLLTGLGLFAPYAANQFKQAVLGISGPTNNNGGAASGGQRSAPKVFAIAPNSVTANSSTQITVTGVGFDPKATISVTTSAAPVTPTSFLVTPNQIQFSVTMPPSSGPYTAVVHINNPDNGQATGTFQVAT